MFLTILADIGVILLPIVLLTIIVMFYYFSSNAMDKINDACERLDKKTKEFEKMTAIYQDSVRVEISDSVKDYINNSEE